MSGGGRSSHRCRGTDRIADIRLWSHGGVRLLLNGRRGRLDAEQRVAECDTGFCRDDQCFTDLFIFRAAFVGRTVITATMYTDRLTWLIFDRAVVEGVIVSTPHATLL
jgi:hypothetical protein